MSVRQKLDRLRTLADEYEATRTRLAELDAASTMRDLRREEEDLTFATERMRLAVLDARRRLALAENTVVAKLAAMA